MLLVRNTDTRYLSTKADTMYESVHHRFFTIWKYNIIHFHAVPDISLIVQLPVFLLAKFARKKIILHLHVGNQIEEYKESRLFQYCMKNLI